MIVQVDWYKITGKWAYGGEVEVKAEPWAPAEILREILMRQEIIQKGWHRSGEFYMVVSDLPESMNDRNYRVTYSRLYKPGDIQSYIEISQTPTAQSD